MPILDILAVEAEKKYRWNYPSKETLSSFQANRGLSQEVLDNCTVHEIVLNADQSEEEQKEIIAWHHARMAEDQISFPNSPLSLDVLEIHILYLEGYIE